MIDVLVRNFLLQSRRDGRDGRGGDGRGKGKKKVVVNLGCGR